MISQASQVVRVSKKKGEKREKFCFFFDRQKAKKTEAAFSSTTS